MSISSIAAGKKKKVRGGGASSPPPPTGDPDSLTVTPLTVTIYEGDTYTGLTPVIKDAEDNVLALSPTSYESLNTAIATVNATTGAITGVVGGEALGPDVVIAVRYQADGFDLVAYVTVTVAVASLLFPNERAGSVMQVDFDPSHPDGGTQNGWLQTGPVEIVDAPWSPNGKALRYRVRGGLHLPLINIAPGTGPYAGMTIITATGLAAAWAADPYSAGRPLAVGDIYAPLGNYIQHAALGPENHPELTIVIDADNLAVPFDSSALPAYTGGRDGGGYVCFSAGVGGLYVYPPERVRDFCTMYYTEFYTATMIRLAPDYRPNLGAGQKLMFGTIRGYYNSYAYAAGFYGLMNDGSWESLGDEHCETVGKVYSGSKVTFNPDQSALLGPTPFIEVVRDVPTLIESRTIGDEEGIANAESHMWYGKTEATAPDASITGFQFRVDGQDGPSIGHGQRSFTVFEIANTFGGGAGIPREDVVFDIAYFRASGRYARPDDQPSHWVLTADTLTPGPGGKARITAELRDLANRRINACVALYSPGNYGDATLDNQIQTNNGATWEFISSSGIANQGRMIFDVTVANTSPTVVNVRDIGRALNAQRYGDWREGTLTLNP